MTVCFKDKTNRLFFYSFIGFLFLFSSCKQNENTVGDDFIGSILGFDVHSSDTSTIITYTSLDDSVPTKSVSYYLLGDMNDPDFGKSSSSIITQYIPPVLSNAWDNKSIHIDSIVLQIKYVGSTSYYGNLNSNQTLKVYELNEDLDKTASYRSDRDYVYDHNAPIGSWNGSFSHIGDSVTYTFAGQQITVDPHIRIKLDAPAFLQKITSVDNSVFANITNFQSIFKGLVIVPETNPLISGQGSIVLVDLKNDFYNPNTITAMVIYYDSTQKVEFPIYGEDNDKYNKFTHEHTLTIPIQPRVGGQNSQTNYVQSMAGLKTRILLPNIFDFVKDKNIAINGAEFIVSLKDGSNLGNYSAPVSMRLFSSDSLGLNDLIIDYNALDGATYYGGVFNSATNQYSFNIIRHFQELFKQYKQNNLNYNYGLNLFIQSDYPVSASRAIIDTRPGKIKLKLSYTVIN